MNVEEVGHAIIGAAIRVHTAVGPGLLESAYEACLMHELGKQGLHARAQVPVPIKYDGLVIEPGFGSIFWSKTLSSSNSKRFKGFSPYTALSFSAI